jgi:P pilus assembly chaperone PapD
MFGLFQWPSRTRVTLAACVFTASFIFYIPVSHAVLALSGTRIVFDGDKRNVTLTISNPSDKVFAVQTWVNTDTDDQTTSVPFIVSPPLFRLNAGKEQQIQINGLPNSLPRDRESLFYFNAQEIPQVTTGQGNQLNIAQRTRIKLFYRPQEIKENPIEMLKTLSWSISKAEGTAHLSVTNPSPFHVSFIRLEVIGNGKATKLDNTLMVAPFSTQRYDLQSVKPGPGLQVNFSAINDYGGFSTPSMLPVSVDF